MVKFLINFNFKSLQLYRFLHLKEPRGIYQCIFCLLNILNKLKIIKLLQIKQIDQMNKHLR